jgi:hypothetical protein
MLLALSLYALCGGEAATYPDDRALEAFPAHSCSSLADGPGNGDIGKWRGVIA